MQTEITDDLTVTEVQSIFTKCYPHLRVNFLERDVHGVGQVNSARPTLTGNHLLGEFRLEKLDEGKLDLCSAMTVKEFGNYFDASYCLHAEVLPLTGKAWPGIRSVDGFTLREFDNIVALSL